MSRKERRLTDNQVIYIDSSAKQQAQYTDEDSIYQVRSSMQQMLLDDDAPLVSIYVIGYNHLEDYTRYCVECILTYTKDIDYELILVDNGSSDGTFEYFQSVKHPKKKIVKISKNIGATYGGVQGINYARGKYIVAMPMDIFVTENWLKNMLACIESDPTIGMVVPKSDNTSNFQDPGLKFTDWADMQRQAKAFNRPDPRKWEERLRIVTLALLWKRECLTVVGVTDVGFVHNFADDDLSFRFRHAGYKVMLCGDVFVHHGGSVVVGKNQEKNQQDFLLGKQVFKHKYYGVDSWDDVNNFEMLMMKTIDFNKKAHFTDIDVLGIDVRCGTPILEVKNKLKLHNFFNTKLHAFTQNAKYWLDLKTICQGAVECDRIEYIGEHFQKASFDYIVLGEPINAYRDPIGTCRQLLNLLAADGELWLKFKNTAEAFELIRMLRGERIAARPEYSLLNFEALLEDIERQGYQVKVVRSLYYVGEDDQKFVRSLVQQSNVSGNIEVAVERLLTNEFIVGISKNIG